MHMNMIDLLAAMAIAIDNQTVAVFGDAFLLGNPGGRGDHAAQSGLVLNSNVVDGGDQHIGYDQNMGRGLR
ncbi:hypothetical protein D3C80_2074400 [compost metagenome]